MSDTELARSLALVAADLDDRGYLAEGRLTVERNRVAATCRGDGTCYRIRGEWGRWECSCAARAAMATSASEDWEW